ncbi:hypothetical protein EDD27_0889 [Nonomuraea polychroma]|uniref:Alpha-L-rhamnosidase-like protein n=1 Tax=Nonomuraea polychroma TaxID=46176 RepID=A0A438LYF6_9ACTN|nr:hypothetical protein [Nonomuraea polychroma]RVX38569.1 hypothetical protein EDD27_0889 [Nonomuraea polychroma]
MTVDVARRLLEYAEAGLPIVLLGDWRAASVPVVARDGENERLRTLIGELLTAPSVRMVAARPTSPRRRPRSACAPTSGTPPRPRCSRPAAWPVTWTTTTCATANTSRTPSRRWLGSTTRSRWPERPRDGVPYLLDPWTGRVQQVVHHGADGDGIRLRVALLPGESMVVAIGRPGLFGTPARTAPHVVATDAGLVRYDGGALVVRASRSGTYTTTLSDGRTVTSVIGPVPEPVVLSSWRLEVEDWRPEGTVAHRLDLDRLTPWSDIPELADVSGIGRYTTDVRVEGGAYLDFGEVTDTCRVRVDGRRLDPVNQLNPVVDLGRGVRTLQVEVATPLGNRLRVADPAVYGGLTRQPYGLAGPVRLVPYGEARVDAR